MFLVNSALVTAPLYLVLYYSEIKYSLVSTLIGIASILGCIYASTFRKMENVNITKNMFLNLMFFTSALLIISLRDNFILITIGYSMIFYTFTLVAVSVVYKTITYTKRIHEKS